MTFPIEKLVSLETLNKFKTYESLLRAWNRQTALVQESTLQDFYNRHILDSLQIIPLIESFVSSGTLPTISAISSMIQPGMRLDSLPETIAGTSIIDVGTGAGFPGLVLAMCGFMNMTLCESNHRKCVFLEEVARQTNTNVTIVNKRAEDIEETFDIILSRACTSLEDLCFLMKSLSRGAMSLGIFHKGKNWNDEVKSSQKKWDFKIQVYQSVTSVDGALLTVKELIKRD